MPIVWDDVVAGTAFTLLAGFLGMFFLLAGVALVPKIVNRLTPNIDEEKEIARGNVAVARYFGGVVQSVIIGMSIIIAAAIISGLHG